MKKFGVLLSLVMPLAIAACTVQIVPPSPTPDTPPVETQIRASAKPVPTAVPKPVDSAEPTVSHADAYVKSYECAETAKPGETVSLKVYYGMPDPSWSFDKLTIEVDEAARQIHVKPALTRRNIPGVAAPAVIVEASATGEFTVKHAGRYSFVSPRYLSGAPKTEIVIGEEEAPRALMTLYSHGGLCPEGACSRTLEVMSDGSYTVSIGDKQTGKGQLAADVLEPLAREIEKADYAALKAVPFTGTCPMAYDGQENVYTFHTAKGSEKLASCTYQLDLDSPLFKAAEAVRAAVEGN